MSLQLPHSILPHDERAAHSYQPERERERERERGGGKRERKREKERERGGGKRERKRWMKGKEKNLFLIQNTQFIYNNFIQSTVSIQVLFTNSQKTLIPQYIIARISILSLLLNV